jgi:hypothetical protein
MMHDDDTLVPNDDDITEDDAPLAGDAIVLDDDTEVGIVPDEEEDLDDLGMKVEGEEEETL